MSKKEKPNNKKIVSVPYNNQAQINDVLKQGGKFLYFSMDYNFYEINKK